MPAAKIKQWCIQQLTLIGIKSSLLLINIRFSSSNLTGRIQREQFKAISTVTGEQLKEKS
jgi:hypothetical protein